MRRALLLLVLLPACSNFEDLARAAHCEATHCDAGPFDAGTADAGAADDAGLPDAGPDDAGVLDAGVSDAGTADAGAPSVLAVMPGWNVPMSLIENATFSRLRTFPSRPGRVLIFNELVDPTTQALHGDFFSLSASDGLFRTVDGGASAAVTADTQREFFDGRLMSVTLRHQQVVVTTRAFRADGSFQADAGVYANAIRRYAQSTFARQPTSLVPALAGARLDFRNGVHDVELRVNSDGALLLTDSGGVFSGSTPCTEPVDLVRSARDAGDMLVGLMDGCAGGRKLVWWSQDGSATQPVPGDQQHLANFEGSGRLWFAYLQAGEFFLRRVPDDAFTLTPGSSIATGVGAVTLAALTVDENERPLLVLEGRLQLAPVGTLTSNGNVSLLSFEADGALRWVATFPNSTPFHVQSASWVDGELVLAASCASSTMPSGPCAGGAVEHSFNVRQLDGGLLP